MNARGVELSVTACYSYGPLLCGTGFLVTPPRNAFRAAADDDDDDFGGGGGGGGGGVRPAGGTALSFSSVEPSSFVLGSEGGHLIKGSVVANELRTARAIVREASEPARAPPTRTPSALRPSEAMAPPSYGR